ncbi:MAG: hypothetical protein AAF915_10430, partial [Cyanobacteria bacterium P01_D01_bin.50]
QKKSDTSPRIYPWNKKNVSLFSSPSIHRWGNNSKFFMSYSKFAMTASCQEYCAFLMHNSLLDLPS